MERDDDDLTTEFEKQAEHISKEDLGDIINVMNDPNIQKIFSNHGLITLMFENDEPSQEALDKMMEDEDVNSVFHNHELMTEIMRLKNKISLSSNDTKEETLTEEEIANIETEHCELVTLFINMGYPKQQIMLLIKKHKANVQDILTDLNK